MKILLIEDEKLLADSLKTLLTSKGFQVTANSLMELIGNSSQVFIMGHKMADLDAVGAAMGINCMCRKKGIKSYIVLDLEKNASEKLLEEIQAVPECNGLFISGQEALLQCDSRSTLVVVDTNRPDQVEFRPLLESVPKVCVVDHHRRAGFCGCGRLFPL